MSLRMLLEGDDIGSVVHLVSTGVSCMAIAAMALLGRFFAFGPELKIWPTGSNLPDPAPFDEAP